MYISLRKNPFALLLTAALLAGGPHAAPAADPPPTRRAEAVQPEPTPKKRGFLGRLFGGEKEPAATPADQEEIQKFKIKRAVPATSDSPTPKAKAKATPRPKATPKPTPKSTPEPEPTPKPKATPKPTPKSTPEPEPTPKPKATPKPEPTPTPKPEATPAPTPEPTPTPTPTPEPEPTPVRASFETAPAFVPDAEPTPGTPAVEDILSEDYQKKMQARYDAVKEKATADEKVSKLKNTAESASPDEEKAALKTYYKALFGKMRELDPELTKRIDRVEKATLSRIGKM